MCVVGKMACTCPSPPVEFKDHLLLAVGSLLSPCDPRDWVQITGLIARTFTNRATLLVLLFRFFLSAYMCAYIYGHMMEGVHVWEMPHLAWGVLLNRSITLDLVHWTQNSHECLVKLSGLVQGNTWLCLTSARITGGPARVPDISASP